MNPLVLAARAETAAKLTATATAKPIYKANYPSLLKTEVLLDGEKLLGYSGVWASQAAREATEALNMAYIKGFSGFEELADQSVKMNGDIDYDSVDARLRLKFPFSVRGGEILFDEEPIMRICLSSKTPDSCSTGNNEETRLFFCLNRAYQRGITDFLKVERECSARLNPYVTASGPADIEI